jgi:hypothetical protein
MHNVLEAVPSSDRLCISDVHQTGDSGQWMV